MSALRRVGILDYGSGNIHSAYRALERVGLDVVVTSDHDQLQACDGLVVPGVGAFSACMSGINAVSGGALVNWFIAADRPVLGICVGHQVLFATGTEHGENTEGLGIYPGSVDDLAAQRLPHIGWNTVAPPAESGLFAGIETERFYFVHSCAAHQSPSAHAVPVDAKVTLARHEGDDFIAAVEWQRVASTQFHPEKSGPAGLHLLANWAGTN